MADHEFRALLRSARQRAAFSQRELAERAGISERAVSDLERGIKKRPHPYTLRALAEALGLEAEAFAAFAAAGSRTPRPAEDDAWAGEAPAAVGAGRASGPDPDAARWDDADRRAASGRDPDALALAFDRALFAFDQTDAESAAALPEVGRPAAEAASVPWSRALVHALRASLLASADPAAAVIEAQLALALMPENPGEAGAEVLCGLAETALAAGSPALAAAAVRDALDILRATGQPVVLAEALTVLAAAAARRSRPGDAAWLLGAAEAQRAAPGIPPGSPPVTVTAMADEARAVARTMLGDLVSAAGEATGRALPLAAAIDRALVLARTLAGDA